MHVVVIQTRDIGPQQFPVSTATCLGPKPAFAGCGTDPALSQHFDDQPRHPAPLHLPIGA
jgi:hypothetical protein